MKNRALRQIVFIVFDVLSIVAAYVISLVTLSFLGVNIERIEYISLILLLSLAKIVIFYLTGLYKVIAKHIDYNEIVKFIIIIFFSNLFLFILTLVKVITFIPGLAFVFIGSLEILFLVGYRIIVRVIIYNNEANIKKHITGRRTLIIGAGSAGELALREMMYKRTTNNFVVGFLDDDESKIGNKILNKTILGRIDELELYIERYAIEVIVVAINNISKDKELELLNVTNNYPNINVKRINVLEDFNKETILKIIDVQVEDLLERDPIDLNNDDILNFIKDEVVLITGGGGSIGSELSRQIFNLKPKTLIIFDIYENNAYDIQTELERIKFKNKALTTELKVIIGSVYNYQRIEEVFKGFKPTIVFHAAAYKHVPLMENNAREAIRTNVIGTFNVSDLANKYHVKKMVLVSSDKAVRSTNMMGATKRYAEVIIDNANKIGPTKFSAVRFGNVLGSNGSVIPVFKKQIEDGGPLTVTHREIERYFMTIPESVGLILQSAVYANGGEIFVLDMGKPIKILDLAKKMIYLSGFTPFVDIDIEFTGLRPGEKLYEELLIDKNSESLRETSNARIFIETNLTTKFKKDEFDEVVKTYESLSNDEVKEMLAKIITSYNLNGEYNEH